ncbi:MAG: putative cell survival pathways protein [Trizodia sp. TS-e1964]|nr:MAG: putative cell survival pathways protein [Trizodia sp. TS-e1964]
MMNWAKQQLAHATGTQEPIYGPQAIQSVAEQAKTTPYSEVTKSDLKWVTMTSTSVETQTWYLTADSGHIGMAQIIYSNVAGIRTNCQFNTKIFYPEAENVPHVWSSDPLSNHAFDAEKLCFRADQVLVMLNDAADSYTIESDVNPNSVVKLTFTRTSPGFQVGKNGTSYFGTDPEEPWGSVRHVFWPKNKVEGSITTKASKIDFKGQGFFIHALQGMKPHHAAARWKFANFQSPKISAVMIEYTTPPSYGSTVVNVGGLTRDGEIICAGSSNTATHTITKEDEENDWPEPQAIKFEWSGITKDGKSVTAVLEGPLGKRLDKVDVMAEVPSFVKSFVGGVVGTVPYIYQYSPRPNLKLKIKIAEEEVEEEGVLLSEAVFVSA